MPVQEKTIETLIEAVRKVSSSLDLEQVLRLVERDGVRILLLEGREVFSAYVRSPKGPVFMALIERTFGKDVTTRTWDTVGKVARA